MGGRLVSWQSVLTRISVAGGITMGSISVRFLRNEWEDSSMRGFFIGHGGNTKVSRAVGEKDGYGSNALGEDSHIFLLTGLWLVERSRMK